MQIDLLVPSDLQHALVAELTEVLKDIHSESAEGDRNTGFAGYEQFLPVLQNDDDDPDQFFPYFIVRLDNWKAVDEEDPWTVTVDILLGVHDEGPNNQGHKILINAIDRILYRFTTEATLGIAGYKAFRCLPEITASLQDEDTYPYFFGGIELKFLAPKPERRTPNYGKY